MGLGFLDGFLGRDIDLRSELGEECDLAGRMKGN